MRTSIATGNSLIEAIVAIAVFMVGVLGVTNLVFSNLNLVERDTDETQRTLLAREGIELARMTRDSNWLSGNAFYAGLANGTDYTCVPKWNPGVDDVPTFDFSPSTLTDSATRVVLQSGGPGDQAFVQQLPGVTGTPTIFRRLITMHPMCDDGTVKDDGQPCSTSVIGVRVESHVQSTQKSVTRDTVLFADLYDWK